MRGHGGSEGEEDMPSLASERNCWSIIDGAGVVEAEPTEEGELGLSLRGEGSEDV